MNTSRRSFLAAATALLPAGLLLDACAGSTTNTLSQEFLSDAQAVENAFANILGDVQTADPSVLPGLQAQIQPYLTAINNGLSGLTTATVVDLTNFTTLQNIDNAINNALAIAKPVLTAAFAVVPGLEPAIMIFDMVAALAPAIEASVNSMIAQIGAASITAPPATPTAVQRSISNVYTVAQARSFLASLPSKK